MNPSRESWDAVVSPLRSTASCNRRLTAAVLEWRTRLSSGEDWRILQAEILCFAAGDPQVLLALFDIAQRYEQPSPPRVVAPTAGRSHRNAFTPKVVGAEHARRLRRARPAHRGGQPDLSAAHTRLV